MPENAELPENAENTGNGNTENVENTENTDGTAPEIRRRPRPGRSTATTSRDRATRGTPAPCRS